MTLKLIRITECTECPNFEWDLTFNNDETTDPSPYCVMLDKYLEKALASFPKDCPLEDVE